MKGIRELVAVILLALSVMMFAACGKAESTDASAPESTEESVAESVEAPAAESEESAEAADTEASKTESAAASEVSTEASSAEAEDTAENAEKNGDVVILFTSDVHCGIDKGFGYAGLYEIRKNLEKQGYTTILVDEGDSIQGETVGTLTKGEAIIDLMNAMKYDIAIPGNHEFDYGADRFTELAEKAEFPYISCNITKNGELLFDPYIILEAADMRIAFVGVTTPVTIVTSTPKYFQNEAGEFIYDFMQDGSGEKLYEAIQNAADAAREEGADYVYLLGHLGMKATDFPYTYADVISHTRGIDAVLDGHSHDSDEVVMKNADGDDVLRIAPGTKLNCVGISRISAEGGIAETKILSWPNSESAPELFGIQNEISEKIGEIKNELNAELDKVVAESSVILTINDPEAKDSSGNPVRMIRRAETNLGDFCADAVRDQAGADIALINGGGIRTDLPKGKITYGDIINVHPFGNELCMIRATGQQILDALEWGVRSVPEQNGGFLQVSGLSYEIDVSVPSGCIADENNMCAGIEGERRVKNVLVGDEPIDPQGEYTVAGTEYVLLENGDGHTAFNDAVLVSDQIRIDSQALIDYITDTLGGTIGEEYADPYGQGRITIVGE